MRKLLPLLLVFALVAPTSWSQEKNAALRAQGRYYSAKEAFEKGRYSDAARMLGESRQMLGGKSNVRLQYLLVLSLYRAGRFKEAQVEMNNYLALEERHNPEKYANFPQNVDALTDDETRAITMLIDKIDTEVANDTEGKRAAADRAARERQEAANRATLLESKRSAALSQLKSCVITSYTGKEAPFPHQSSAYNISYSFYGTFTQLKIEAQGNSDQINHNNTRWIPKERNLMTCTVDLSRIKAINFSTVAPYSRNARSANGQGFTFNVGGFCDSEMIVGRSDAPTVFLTLIFSSAFSKRTKMHAIDDEGSVVKNDDNIADSTSVTLPVHDEESARKALAALKAASKS